MVLYIVVKDCVTTPVVDSNGSEDFDSQTVSTTYGSELLYKCNPGYTPENTTITCDATGSWDSQHSCTSEYSWHNTTNSNSTFIALNRCQRA